MKIIEVLRMYEMGMSQREISSSTGCGKTTIGDILRLCKANGICHEVASRMNDDELQSVLYPKDESSKRPEPDWDAVHEELARHKNLNLQFMWEEYREQHPEDGLSYSRFCEIYREYRKDAGREVSLYHERKAGEIMETDWMGDTLKCVVDGETGELVEAHFFVAILGFSHNPYVEAFPDEQESAWITAHVNALSYYQGIPRVVTPDNCKTAVISPKYYEPTINSAYWEFAQHYGVAIIPARSWKPKDKPAVEYTVGWLETWLLGKIRNQRFFSFTELNRAIIKHIRELSLREFKKRNGSRHSEFIRVDKPALRPLPTQKYEIADVVKRKVGDNYHLEYEGFQYSVPYTLYGKELILRATSTTIEVIDKERIRVASHARRYNAASGRYVSKEEHMPANHRAVYQRRQFDGRRYRYWASSIGESTSFIIDNLLTSGAVEEQGYKSCMGVLQFSKTYGAARLEAACRRARELGSHTYTTVKKILKNGLENTIFTMKATPDHENIRGSGYYR